MFWTAVLGVVVTTILYLYLKYKKAQRYWPDNGIDLIRPKRNMLISMIKREFDFVKGEADLYNQVKGKKFAGIMELINPALYVTDLDLIKQICIKDFDHFVNRRGFDMEKNDPHMHYSLFNEKSENWKQLRIKMSPTFTTGKIRRMFSIFNSSAEKLVKALEDEAKSDNGCVEIKPFIQRLTMDVIASAAFGLQTNLFDDPKSVFAQNALRLQDIFSAKKLPKLFMMLLFPRITGLLGMRLTDEQADKFLSKVIIDSLNHRMNTGEKRDDFLQLLLEARLGQLKQDEESDELDAHEKSAQFDEDPASKSKVVFSDDVIIAQCLLFFLAGFDTTESMITFAVYELAINPDIQQKLYEKLKEAMENNNDELTYDVINNLEYLDMVVQETLRKYPPATRTDRRSTQPYKFPGTDYVLPKDIVVLIPIHPIHHDPDFWPNPDKFDPERFTKANSANRHPCAFIPFGTGPRNCIGNRFALTEAKAAIAHLLLKYVLEPSEKTVIPAVYASQAPLKPADNTPIRIKPRLQ